MKIQKERNHKYGASNIDFRTKRDDSLIKTYQPWIMGKNMGTFGISDFHLSHDDKKNKFSNVKRISTWKDYVNEYPNPKFHKTCDFYKKINMKVKPKVLFADSKVAELDESFLGKEGFYGDSMMISLNTKLKQKDKNLSTQDRIKRIAVQENLSKAKTSNNKNSIQETQLVKIDAKESLQGKVDLDKIKEIQLAIRRRYANRKNLRKIFKTWDDGNNGIVNIFDAHRMINKLSIPINFNETRVLIASASKGEEGLTLEDFNNLVYNENQITNFDLTRMKCKFLLYIRPS